MSLHHRRWLLPLALATATLSTHAETPNSTVETVRANPQYRHAVEVAAQQYESSLRSQCASVVLAWNQANAHVALAPTMDDQHHIVSGVWVENVPGEACGEHRAYNAITIFQAGKPFVAPLVPGESESNPVLQRDTRLYVNQALTVRGVLPQGCRVDMLETRLPDGRPHEGDPWKERWRVDACGNQYWVTVHYAPDATGTQITTSAKDVVPAT